MNWLNKIDDLLDRILPASSNSAYTDQDEIINHEVQDLVKDVIHNDREEIFTQHQSNFPSEDKFFIEDPKTKKNEIFLIASNSIQNKRLPGTIKSKRRPRIEPTKNVSQSEVDLINATTVNATQDDSSSLASLSLQQPLIPKHTLNSFDFFLQQANQELERSSSLSDNTENHMTIMSTNSSTVTHLNVGLADNSLISQPYIRDEKNALPTAFSIDETLIQQDFSSLPILDPEQEEETQLSLLSQKIPSNVTVDTVQQSEATLPLCCEYKLEDHPELQKEETLFVRHESPSSQLFENGKDSASIALDYVRNQAQSLRAVMGDLDYAFEQAIEDRDSDYDDNSSNITEEEGEDYNYGDHIIPWTLDRIDHDWDIPSSFIEFHPSMNCHGVFHIRLIRGQHLPCTAKSTIQTIISLPPWKGKIKTPCGQTYKGPSRAGTCFRWNCQNTMNENSEDSTYFSMIHTYNNQETPVPTIMIQVKDVSYSMFEKDLFSISLCCKPLMKSPCVWRRRWCIADIHSDSTKRKRGKLETVNIESLKDDIFTDMTMPLILLEAVFEPRNFSDAQSNDNDRMEILAQDESSHFSESPNRRNVQLVEVSSVSSSTAGIPIPALVRKGFSSGPHLFRIATTWKLGHCSVCSGSTGLWNRYYQCEVCGLDCCSDCQLRVDLELPCGSEAAEMKVNRAKESKITIRRLMAILAPIREEDQMKNINLDASSSTEGLESKSLGILKIKVHKAVLFQRTFPAEIDIIDMHKVRDRWSRVGDYYIRISWSDGNGENKRTKTVFQTSSPIFESDEILIPVKTYGSEYLVEAIDANTDKAIGATLLSTQGVLQWQRDELVSNEGIRFRSILSYPICPPTIKRTLELRVPWKHGFGLEFYKTGKVNDTNQVGEVTGLIDVDLTLKENSSLLSFTNPSDCPERPTHDFNLDLIQIHIARIKALIDDIYSLLDSYYFLVSWDNRALTSFSLLIFVTVCLTLKAEYIGSLPVFTILVTMMYLRRIRAKGDFMTRWIKKEVKNRKGDSQIVSSTTNIYRPAGTIEVGVGRGQHLISQHGLPGSVVVQILLDPTAFLDDKMKNKIGDIDPSSKCVYHVGTTESCGVTSFPKWKNVIRSEEFERLKNFLPENSVFDEIMMDEKDKGAMICGVKNDECPTVTFPLLQPIMTSPIKQYDSDGNVIDSKKIDLVPWELSPAGIIFRVRFCDVLNRSLFEEKLGDVIIPVKEIARQGEIQDWFQVTNSFTTNDINTSLMESLMHHDQKMISNSINDNGKILDKNATPSLFISARLSMPSNHAASDVEKETSIAIEEEYIRSSYHILNPRLGIIETSINTLTSVRGVGENVLYLQNQLGYMLDFLEMIRNLFNFSCPEKSMLLLSLFLLLWLILMLIPTRLVILCLGLGQYISTFMSAFYCKSESYPPVLNRESNDSGNDNATSPVFTWLTNFLFSTPTDEDLRRCYFWETRRHAEQELAKVASIRRSARLTKLWKASWFGSLEMWKGYHLKGGNEGLEWENIFAIVLGHRFLFWPSEKHFDQGEKPLGRVLFSGHSGLSGLSPLELRLLKNVDLSQIVSVFGRGETDQMKIIVMTPDHRSKETLEIAVIKASTDFKAD